MLPLNAPFSSAASADNQLAIQLFVQLLLLALPRRRRLILGDVTLSWLPMTDRSKPGQMRRQLNCVV